MKHFCRTHGYWAGKGSTAQPWTKMPKSRLCQDFQSDIQVWACYVTGHLPSEHPLVKEDKTNVDWALEGAFMGWHYTTPTFW
eukprot:766051-Rhodomonas_salina.1